MPKAINISAAEIEKLTELDSNWVIISINNEYEDYFKIGVPESQLEGKILRLKFMDVTNDCIVGHNTYHTISLEQSLKLISFAEKHKDKDFLIHCSAGISRSSAVCMYLHLTYGHKLKGEYWNTSDPNVYVLGSLMVAREMKNADYALKFKPIRRKSVMYFQVR